MMMMVLKYISIPELNLAESWDTGLNKIKALNKFDRFMTIFWLLGHFIYLIEKLTINMTLFKIFISENVFFINFIY